MQATRSSSGSAHLMITRGMSWACRAAAAVLLPLLLPALLPPGLAGAGAGVGIRVAEAKTLERDGTAAAYLHDIA